MKTLMEMACWGVALKALAHEISLPTPTGIALRGDDPMKIVALALQLAEKHLAAMPPEQRRTELLNLAQRMSIEVIEDADHAE